MVVSNRKAVSGDPHTLSPTPRSSTGGRPINGLNNSLKHNLPAEYLDAINVLNENTLNQACELVLLENDDTASSASKLLEVYHKCQSAFSVVQKQTYPSALPSLTGISSASGIIVNSAMAPRSTLNKKLSINNNKHGVIPMRGRKSLPQHQRRDRSDSTDKSELPSAKKSRLHASSDPHQRRDRSDSNDKSELPSAKKSRLHASSDPGPAPSESPPPNAVNFLAKLNKGDSATPTFTKRKSRKTFL
jgi:hypothetical protein